MLGKLFQELRIIFLCFQMLIPGAFEELFGFIEETEPHK
jgi:hypothetical protein